MEKEEMLEYNIINRAILRTERLIQKYQKKCTLENRNHLISRLMDRLEMYKQMRSEIRC